MNYSVIIAVEMTIDTVVSCCWWLFGWDHTCGPDIAQSPLPE